jgi:hypothetical protein
MAGFTATCPCKPYSKIEIETVPDFLFERAKYFAGQGCTTYLVHIYTTYIFM